MFLYCPVQVYEPIDKLPLYGQDPLNALQTEGVHYVVSGDSGQGTTGGTIAGKLISDQILGQRNVWTSVSCVFCSVRILSTLRGGCGWGSFVLLLRGLCGESAAWVLR